MEEWLQRIRLDPPDVKPNRKLRKYVAGYDLTMPILTIHLTRVTNDKACHWLRRFLLDQLDEFDRVPFYVDFKPRSIRNTAPRTILDTFPEASLVPDLITPCFGLDHIQEAQELLSAFRIDIKKISAAFDRAYPDLL